MVAPAVAPQKDVLCRLVEPRPAPPLRLLSPPQHCLWWRLTRRHNPVYDDGAAGITTLSVLKAVHQ